MTGVLIQGPAAKRHDDILLHESMRFASNLAVLSDVLVRGQEHGLCSYPWVDGSSHGKKVLSDTAWVKS